MAIKSLLSFSTGELDPILHDRITLEKFNKGLATARNVMVSKTGSLMSRFARANFVKARYDDSPIKIYCPPNGNVLMEWGNNYLRGYDFDGNILYTVLTTFASADLDNLHFATTEEYVYVFESGGYTDKVNYNTGAFDPFPLTIPTTAIQIPTITITPTGGPAGYAVDYAIAFVYEGEEYIHYDLTSAGSFNVPIAAGQSNTISMTLLASYVQADIDKCNEVRVYRRPNGGGAFGYIGSTTNFSWSGTNITCSFIDLGGNADFTNGPIEIVTARNSEEVGGTANKTGTIYQGRLLIALEDTEIVVASRPGYTDNFYRDFPYDNDSALLFKNNSSGRAEILRMIDKDGLIAFTKIGPFISLGLLTPDNLGFERKGDWVIDENVPPLALGGGVFFIEKENNTVMQFVFSDQIGTYQGLEHSIFSNHLFEEKTVTSWAYQRGVNPLLILTFSDGTFATFTYSLEHQMRAWTRHDSKYPVEQVEGTNTADSTFFVVNKNGNRYIEVSLPRKIPASTFASNPEADKLALNYLVDSAKTKQSLLNDSLVGTDVFTLTPTVVGDWESPLTLTCGTSAIFTDPGPGAVNTIFRFFDTTDKTFVDLTVTARASDDEVTVTPSSEFPSDQASGFRLYETFVTITGLDHLEGESVAVVVDGAVIASPNNDEDPFKTYTVVSGQITLDDEDRGAIIVVGRPITADIKTLDITTVEQKRSMLESLTVNKLYIKLFKTRGLYVSDVFPEEKIGEKDGTSVSGMEDMEKSYVPDGYDILGNKYRAPVTVRAEQTIAGNWKSNGKVSIRQVDPLHFEIQSIIPDAEVLWRSDR